MPIVTPRGSTPTEIADSRVDSAMKGVSFAEARVAAFPQGPAEYDGRRTKLHQILFGTRPDSALVEIQPMVRAAGLARSGSD